MVRGRLYVTKGDMIHRLSSQA